MRAFLIRLVIIKNKFKEMDFTNSAHLPRPQPRFEFWQKHKIYPQY
jgi:hypothetical protein